MDTHLEAFTCKEIDRKKISSWDRSFFWHCPNEAVPIYVSVSTRTTHTYIYFYIYKYTSCSVVVWMIESENWWSIDRKRLGGEKNAKAIMRSDASTQNRPSREAILCAKYTFSISIAACTIYLFCQWDIFRGTRPISIYFACLHKTAVARIIFNTMMCGYMVYGDRLL